MPPVTGVIVDLAGYLTGIALYVMLAAMVWREHARDGAWWLTERGRLPLATAICGVVWNLGALTSLVFDVAGGIRPSPYVVAVAFAALGFLPAVVVHSLLEGREAGASHQVSRWLIRCSYALGAVASVLHFWNASQSLPVPSRPALWLLTCGFGALMALLIVITRDQPLGRRGTWVAALAFFAVSAMHFGRHVGNESWWVELVGHHASLPLALAILLQDYRFAFADLFLKNAIALLLLVGASVTVWLGVAAPLLRWHEADGALDPQAVALLGVAWMASVASFPVIRRLASRFVDRVVLRRPDYEATLNAFVDGLSKAGSEEEVTRLCGEVAATAIGASTSRAIMDPLPDDDCRIVIGVQDTRSRLPDAGAALALRIHTVDPARYSVVFGSLAAGRRLLSDDVRLLESMARWAARRLDSLRVAQERHDRNLRENDMRRLATEAELRALRAQLNPHFLFNALTTIGYLIETAAPERSLGALTRLTSLLRSVLRQSVVEWSTLGDEIDLIAAYLDLEQARFEERLTVAIDVPDALRIYCVPSLILQPLVENAVTHGLAPRRHGGSVRVAARLDRVRLMVCIEDSGQGFSVASPPTAGLGLRHVRERLRALYGEDASLDIVSDHRGTNATVALPVQITPAERPVGTRRRIG